MFRITSLKASLDEKAEKSWTYLGQLTDASSHLGIPTTAKEIMVRSAVGSRLLVSIFDATWTDETAEFRDGWYMTASDNGGISVKYLTNRAFYVIASYQGGSAKAINSSVYYR